MIERLDARGIVLSGYEIDTVDGAPVQYVQVWLVKSLAGTIVDAGARLPRRRQVAYLIEPLGVRRGGVPPHTDPRNRPLH